MPATPRPLAVDAVVLVGGIAEALQTPRPLVVNDVVETLEVEDEEVVEELIVVKDVVEGDAVEEEVVERVERLAVGDEVVVADLSRVSVRNALRASREVTHVVTVLEILLATEVETTRGGSTAVESAQFGFGIATREVNAQISFCAPSRNPQLR